MKVRADAPPPAGTSSSSSPSAITPSSAPLDAPERKPAVLVSTIDSVAGHRVVRTLGLVRGSAVRAHHFGTDLIAFLKNLFGGEIEEATKVLAEAREQALDRMIAEARSLGANAVIGFHFTSAEVVAGAAEMVAYGTAVEIQPDRSGPGPDRSGAGPGAAGGA